MNTYFPGISKVAYEGPKSTNPLAFRYYNPEEVVAGKTMREQLKFALSYWHTLCGDGTDMFGRGTFVKDFGESDPMAVYRAKAYAAFELMDKLDIDHDHRRKLCVGDTVTFPGITITACRADHGTMAPDAIGLLVEMGGHRLYFSGDTAFHADLCKEVAAFGPEVAALSINGAFGNMTAWEGAEAANLVGASIAIPCHFWTFTEHGGAPWVFSEFLKKIGDCEPVCMRQGEMLLLAREA